MHCFAQGKKNVSSLLVSLAPCLLDEETEKQETLGTKVNITIVIIIVIININIIFIVITFPFVVMRSQNILLFVLPVWVAMVLWAENRQQQTEEQHHHGQASHDKNCQEKMLQVNITSFNTWFQLWAWYWSTSCFIIISTVARTNKEARGTGDLTCIHGL